MAKKTKKTNQPTAKTAAKSRPKKAVKSRAVTPVKHQATVTVPGVGEIETEVTLFEVRYKDEGPVTCKDREEAKEILGQMRSAWKASNPTKKKTKGEKAIASALKAIHRALELEGEDEINGNTREHLVALAEDMQVLVESLKLAA